MQTAKLFVKSLLKKGTKIVKEFVSRQELEATKFFAPYYSGQNKKCVANKANDWKFEVPPSYSAPLSFEEAQARILAIKEKMAIPLVSERWVSDFFDRAFGRKDYFEKKDREF